MADDKNVRHRFTVPSADDVVNDWIENQSNLGFSLRVLIRAFVRQYGNKDATCVEFGEAVAKRGRPRNQDLIRLGQMTSTDEEYDDDDEQYVEEPVQAVSEPKKSRPVKPTVVEPVVEEVVVQPVQQVQAQMPVQNDSSDIMSLFSAGSTMNRGNKSEKPVVSNMNSQPKGMSVNEDGFLDID